MVIIKEVINLIFSAALFVNAALFVPQAWRIFRERSTKGVSLTTFLGFLLIQFAIVLHAVIAKDYILLYGYLLSMLTCGSVVLLVLRYRSNTVNGVSLEEIIAQLPGHIYWKDVNGKFLGSNTSNWQDFGFRSLREYIGSNDYDILDKEAADATVILDQEVLRSGKMLIREEYLKTKKGENRCYLSYKQPLKKMSLCSLFSCLIRSFYGNVYLLKVI